MLVSRGVARPLPPSRSSRPASSPTSDEMVCRLKPSTLWLNEDLPFFLSIVLGLWLPSSPSSSCPVLGRKFALLALCSERTFATRSGLFSRSNVETPGGFCWLPNGLASSWIIPARVFWAGSGTDTTEFLAEVPSRDLVALAASFLPAFSRSSVHASSNATLSLAENGWGGALSFTEP